MGEVIEIEGNLTTIQVYEETSDVAPGEPVGNTGEPLSVDLGPGMMDSIYDGVQRPLDVLEERMGAFLDRGVDAPGIDLEKTWEFTPTVEEGDAVEPGDVVGSVPETPSIDHKVMVPPGSEGGQVVSTESGNFTVEETVVELDTGEEIRMRQEWPVRQPRPTVGVSFSTVGRGCRTGHSCRIRISSPVSSSTTGSSTVKFPDSTLSTSPPSESGGTSTLWSMLSVSGTVPTTSPGATASPAVTSGVNSQVRSRSMPGASTPRSR